MQRALGRAHQRLKGNHPRRPKTRFSHLAELGCDALLVAACAAVIGGAATMLWGALDGVELSKLIVGAALVALGPMLLLLWERLAWEPFVERLSHLT